MSGRLAVAGDTAGEVAGDVVSEDGRLSILAGDELLGAWPASEVRGLDLGEGRFGLVIGDERLLFTPADPEVFRGEVLPLLDGMRPTGIGPAEPVDVPHVVLGGPVAPEHTGEAVATLDRGEPPNGQSGPWSDSPMPAVPEDLYGARPDDDRPTAAIPDEAALAPILAKAIVDVRDGALDPERGRAMAALAAAYVEVAARRGGRIS